MMETHTLQQDLRALLVFLQGLNPQHLATVCQFLRHKAEDLLLDRLAALLQEASPPQVDHLVSLTSSNPHGAPPGVGAAKRPRTGTASGGRRAVPSHQHPEEAEPDGDEWNHSDDSHNNDDDDDDDDVDEDVAAMSKLPKEMVASFGLLVQVYQLNQLLNRFSLVQLMKVFEFVPTGPQVQQLQLLQQLQQLLGQLLPDTLISLHQELVSAESGQEQEVLAQLLQLRKEHFHLYQPLRMLLQLEVEDLLALQDALPRLQPVQMLQLLALLQLQPFDVLELKRIFSPRSTPETPDSVGISPLATLPLPVPIVSGVVPSNELVTLHPQLPQPVGAPSTTNQPAPPPPALQAPRARPLLRLVEQPPEKSVYKRNLKPNPTLQLVEEEIGMESNLYIAPVLIRCDTLEEKNKLLTGNKPVKVAPGRVTTFRRLKIMATSHQQGESLFAIRFELRRYHGNEYEILDYVQSNPICVLSHSTQLRPVSSMTPSVTEVIPYSGSTSGGTRVAVLGTNFVDSPSARVRFDNIDVMPVFHGPRTLICTTPPHQSGIVSVRVSNDSKSWSPTAASFTYEDRNVAPAQTTSASTRPNFEFSYDDTDIAQAAWQGSPNLLNLSEEKRGSESIDAPDGRGYTALHIVASKGEDSAVKTLLLHGASTEKRDIYGNTALHWASGQGHHHIVQTLLEFGADPNSGNNQLETPLHWAAACGHANICATLAQAGALSFIPTLDGDTPLHRAAAIDSCQTIQTLLKYGAPINAQDEEGETPLHYALREGCIASAMMLLENGANPGLLNVNLEAPLHFASLLMHVDLVQELLQAGAEPCGGDETGATPLHWAAEVGSAEALAALLSGGAKPELTDSFGLTALAYALHSSASEEVVGPLLLSAASEMDKILSSHLETACNLIDADVDDLDFTATAQDSMIDVGLSSSMPSALSFEAQKPQKLPPLSFGSCASLGFSSLSISPGTAFPSSFTFPPLGFSSLAMTV